MPPTRLPHEDDMDKEKQPDPTRRSLLKAAPLGALAIAAAARARAPEPEAPVVAEPAPQKGRGYHETEHIRHYYRTAAYW
jgi:hypothetical protein